MRRAIPPAIVAALVAAAPAPAALRLDGHGFGHGVGLSQWGAYGYAERGDKGFRFILRHYYPGTALRRVPGARVRVLLKDGRQATVSDATSAVDARGRRTRLREGRRYRFTPAAGGGLRLRRLGRDRTLARMRQPVRVSGGTVRLHGDALNDRRARHYRGTLLVRRSGPVVPVVNAVPVKKYLFGVVPAEMPASWPAAALRAQAVAARSYVLRSLRPGATYDVLPSVASQVYGGVEEEQRPTTRAVRATNPLAVFHRGSVAHTFFFSSSGGRTAAVQEGFPGAAPMPYLRSVRDPWDRLSPHHDWSVRLTDRQARERLDDVAPGRFRSMRVVSRGAAGRVLAVRVRGTRGSATVAGTTIQAELGLRSTWFAVRR